MKRVLAILSIILIVLSSPAQNRGLGRGTPEAKRAIGLGLTIAGVSFTSAAILQTSNSYQISNSNFQIPQTTSKPFIQQTPRQAMLFVGVGFTITGLITFLVNR